MYVAIYYRKEDEWLLKKINEIAAGERRSRSVVIWMILEEYFEREKNLGEILQDMGFISLEQFEEALQLQKKEKKGKELGQILREKGIITDEHLQRALRVQKNSNRLLSSSRFVRK